MAEPSFNRSFVYDIHQEEIEETSKADEIYFRIVKPALEKSPKGDIPIFTMNSHPRVTKRRSKKELQKRRNDLFRDSIESRINVFDLDADTEVKKLVLRDIMGYRSVNGARSLDEAKPRAVGHTYLEAYKRSDIYQNQH